MQAGKSGEKVTRGGCGVSFFFLRFYGLVRSRTVRNSLRRAVAVLIHNVFLLSSPFSPDVSRKSAAVHLTSTLLLVLSQCLPWSFFSSLSDYTAVNAIYPFNLPSSSSLPVSLLQPLKPGKAKSLLLYLCTTHSSSESSQTLSPRLL